VVDTLQLKRDQERNKLRATIKQQRKALSNAELEKAAHALFLNCTPFFSDVKSVAGYQAMSGEIPLNPIFDYCHNQGITTLLPIMRNKALMFAPFDATTSFSTKQYGIQEPDADESQWLTPNELELVLVPLVAFDKTCNRIGMGGGFYDRSFEFRKTAAGPPTLVGVAHELQRVDDVFVEDWDVGLDFVVSDVGVVEAPMLRTLAGS